MSFIGYQNAFNLVNEINSRDPVRTVSRAGYASLSLVTVLYLLTNVAYVAVIPKEEIEGSGQLVAALLFQKVFGEGVAGKLLPLMVACSCLGNIVSLSSLPPTVLASLIAHGSWDTFCRSLLYAQCHTFSSH